MKNSDTLRNVLLISFSPTHRDPRVLRQVEALAGWTELHVAGFGEFSRSDVSFFNLKGAPRSGIVGKKLQTIRYLFSKATGLTYLLFRLYRRYYWSRPAVRRAVKSLHGHQFDLIIANDFDTLPFALHVAGQNTKVVLDAHEYAPDEIASKGLNSVHKRYVHEWLVSKHIAQPHKMITVSESIAVKYANTYGVTKPDLILNAPGFQLLMPKTVGSKVRLVHHGGASRPRKLELMIEMMSHLDKRFELYFMLVNSSDGYLEELQNLARSNPRIHFLPPVETVKISETVNQFDMGVYIHPAETFNDEHCLPNKFFEFIQGRLGVAIGPSPAMAKIVDQEKIGVVASSFEPKDLAAKLNELNTGSIQLFKENSHQIAKLYSAESGLSKIRALLGQD